MYVCKHCGFVSHNENINYCNNIRCNYYGYSDMTHGGDFYEPMQEPVKERRELRREEPKREDMPYKTFAPTNNPNNPNIPNNNIPNIPNNNNMFAPKADPAKYEGDKESCGRLGFATVPMQKFEQSYPHSEAIIKGTIFPSLYMPYDKKILWRG